MNNRSTEPLRVRAEGGFVVMDGSGGGDSAALPGRCHP